MFHKLLEFLIIEEQEKINKTKKILKNLLIKIKNQNKTIAGYGAAAKTTTLLNYFNIGNEIIDFIVDDNRLKQNRFTPGTHIPIFSSKELYKKKTGLRNSFSLELFKLYYQNA